MWLRQKKLSSAERTHFQGAIHTVIANNNSATRFNNRKEKCLPAKRWLAMTNGPEHLLVEIQNLGLQPMKDLENNKHCIT